MTVSLVGSSMPYVRLLGPLRVTDSLWLCFQMLKNYAELCEGRKVLSGFINGRDTIPELPDSGKKAIERLKDLESRIAQLKPFFGHLVQA